jgi:hypothetical protein
MNIRHADEIRTFIRDNALPSYNPAIQWDEILPPFDTDSPIIYCRQEGRSVDAFVRQVDVTVYLFSGLNATLAELNQLYTDAVAALEYIKANYNVTDGIRATVTQDVMGEYRTGQNRRYYTFSVLCYSAEES